MPTFTRAIETAGTPLVRCTGECRGFSGFRPGSCPDRISIFSIVVEMAIRMDNTKTRLPSWGRGLPYVTVLLFFSGC